MKGTTLNFSENCLDGGGHYIHPNMLSRWHKEFLERAPELFKRGQTDAEKALKEERDRSQHLEKLVGQLTYEVDWLKKKSAQLGIKAGKA